MVYRFFFVIFLSFFLSILFLSILSSPPPIPAPSPNHNDMYGPDSEPQKVLTWRTVLDPGFPDKDTKDTKDPKLPSKLTSKDTDGNKNDQKNKKSATVDKCQNGIGGKCQTTEFLTKTPYYFRNLIVKATKVRVRNV